MLIPLDTWGQVLYVFIFSSLRYMILGGLAFLLFYIFLRRKPLLQKIQNRWPQGSDYRREITYSFITFLFFAMVPLVLNIPWVIQHTNIYRNISAYGMWYFWLVFPLLLLIHDAYFYWTHRLMHHPRLFRIFHLVHHKSTNPSPWASFAFSPAEAVVESSIIYVFVFLMPVHPIHLFSFLIFMTVYNVYGHLGYEIWPKGFSRHWLGKWFNSSVNHNMHHQYFKGNYGLYFTFWDKLMGTTQQNYHDNFDKVTAQNKQPAVVEH